VKSKTKAANELARMSPFDKFTTVMDGLMTVPHSELKRVLDQEKKQKARKKRARTSRASHVSSAKG
jgi:ssDNA-specific exonuclease RecJ